MTELTDFSKPLRVAELKPNKDYRFKIEPSTAALNEIAKDLDILSVRKLRFEGKLKPHGKNDWLVEAALGATVSQACVVTLDPVTTRIDEKLVWRLIRDWHASNEAEDEIEMPEDDSTAPLGEHIDVLALMQEALALHLPAYPRADDAPTERVSSAPPGVKPLEDEDVKPFAELAAMKKQMDENPPGQD